MHMDTNAVRKLIRAEIRQTSVVDFARRAGVTRAQVYAVLNGTREPRGGVLDALGLEAVIVYRRKKSAD